jgi:ferric-dicitrate binding protein FerR (iron transport regulator)
MKRACAALPSYLDGQLTGPECSEVEVHIRSCTACAEAYAAWQRTTAELEEWSRERQVAAPDAVQVQALLTRLDHRPQPAPSGGSLTSAPQDRPWLPSWAVATVAFVLLLTGGLWWRLREEPLSPQSRTQLLRLVRLAGEGETPLPTTPSLPVELSVPGPGQLRVGLDADRIALDGESRARLLSHEDGEVRWEVAEGRVVFAVAPRHKNAVFVVQSAGYEARVVGTRFMVEHNRDGQVVVAVTEGVVDISGSGQAARIEKGASLTLAPGNPWRRAPVSREAEARLNQLLGEGVAPSVDHEPAIHSAKQPEPRVLPPQRTPRRQATPVPLAARLDEWRRRASDGDCPAISAEIRAMLSSSSFDAAALALLAGCERKQKHWQQAVGVYRDIVRQAGPAEANRARYWIGVIEEDSLEALADAEESFRQYLAEDRSVQPLAAEVLLRLADVLYASGKIDEGCARYREVTDQYQGSTAAISAARKLSQCRAPK